MLKPLFLDEWLAVPAPLNVALNAMGPGTVIIISSWQNWVRSDWASESGKREHGMGMTI